MLTIRALVFQTFGPQPRLALIALCPKEKLPFQAFIKDLPISFKKVLKEPFPIKTMFYRILINSFTKMAPVWPVTGKLPRKTPTQATLKKGQRPSLWPGPQRLFPILVKGV